MKRTAIALIDESRCIGCAQCLAPCPVDAIIGAQGWLHAVLQEDCIGCALCLPPCPVDCIAMVPAPGAWTLADVERTRELAQRRKARLAEPVLAPGDRKALLSEAVARSRARRTVKAPPSQ